MRTLQISFDHIPAVLKNRDQWVGFKLNGHKKTPCVADNPTRLANCIDRKTWRPFDVAVDGYRRGAFNAIGYALDGDYIAVDLDDCLHDGQLAARAAEIIRRCDSYSESSISGNGVHVWLAGKFPYEKGRRLPHIEVYGRKRFFIPTGNRLPNTPKDIRENPDAISWLLDGVTENAETIETTEAICSAVSVVSVTLTLEELIAETTPKRPRERNARLFDLARGLRFNMNMAGRPLSELKPIVRQWHKAALSVIRTKDFTETWSDFIHAWPRVKVPFGADLLGEAWQRSQNDPAPAVATDYDAEPARCLIRLCHALARLSLKSCFFLSTHDAARFLKTKPMQIYRWLRMLIADGIIEVTQNGNEHRATRFRWIAPVEGKQLIAET